MSKQSINDGGSLEDMVDGMRQQVGALARRFKQPRHCTWDDVLHDAIVYCLKGYRAGDKINPYQAVLWFSMVAGGKKARRRYPMPTENVGFDLLMPPQSIAIDGFRYTASDLRMDLGDERYEAYLLKANEDAHGNERRHIYSRPCRVCGDVVWRPIHWPSFTKQPRCQDCIAANKITKDGTNG